MPSEELARRLGLSPSNYRLLESGATTLQPNRALRVVYEFDEVEFTSLANFLVASDILWSPDDQVGQIQNRLQDLELLVPEMKKFLSELGSALHSLGDNHDLREIVEKRSLPQVLELFLRGQGGGLESDTDFHVNEEVPRHLAQVMRNLSPLFLDAIGQTMESLEGMTLRFSPPELFLFEEKNAERFEEVCAVLRSPTLFINTPSYDDNGLSIVGYRYLWRRTFRRLTVVYGEGPPQEETLKQFKAKLQAAMDRKADKFAYELAHFDEGFDKLGLYRLTDPPFDSESRTELTKILQYRGRDMNHFWLYSVTAGGIVQQWQRHVGFIDNAPSTGAGSETVGEILNLSETKTRKRALEKILGKVKA